MNPTFLPSLPLSLSLSLPLPLLLHLTPSLLPSPHSSTPPLPSRAPPGTGRSHSQAPCLILHSISCHHSLLRAASVLAAARTPRALRTRPSLAVHPPPSPLTAGSWSRVSATAGGDSWRCVAAAAGSWSRNCRSFPDCRGWNQGPGRVLISELLISKLESLFLWFASFEDSASEGSALEGSAIGA